MLNSIDVFLVLITLAVFLVGFYLKTQRWKIGLKENRCDNMSKRVGEGLKRVFAHSDVLREKARGYSHFALFYIFCLALFFVALFQLPIKLPSAFSILQSLVLDLLGLGALVGVIYFFKRRLNPEGKGFDNKTEDFVMLGALFVIIITGFLMEALRLKVTKEGFASAPIGTIFSFLIPNVEQAFPFMAKLFWRVHFFLILAVIAYLPFSKFIHILLIPMSYIYKNNSPKGVFKLYDLDNAEEFGANKLADLTWKDLMDLDTCVRCGRCQDNCPAHLTKKHLSPKKVIQDLKKVLDKSKKGEALPLLGEDITSEIMFSCTTCRACQENCPAGIEHLEKFTELKRYLVLMESNISPELQLLYKNLERNGNPWGMPASTRGDWAKDLGVPFMAELEKPEDIDFVFWPGCAGAFDDRYMRVVKKVVEIFKIAGYKFALLGEEETCCGDPARKSGNEYLYDAVARTNVETMNGYNIKNIVTSCPHCFNTLSKDYAQIGGSYNVKTHVQLIEEAIKTGKIKLNKTESKKIAYHDSCYLARYNGICDEPRNVLKSLGNNVYEFERNRIKGFCCGAGGGAMFLEEHSPRINETRFSHVIENPATKDVQGIAVACPFCLTMMVDGGKNLNREDIEVKDISELVYDAIDKNC